MNRVNLIVFLIIIVKVSSQIDTSGGEDVVLDDIEGVDDFLLDNPIRIDSPSVDLHSVDYFLEERPELDKRENDHDALRAADPTLHKWKNKRPLFHSHTHTHTHTITHGNPHGIEQPVLVYPANNQFSHQPQIIYPPKNQFTIIKDHGYESNSRPLNLNSNNWDQSFQQNAHSAYTQDRVISHQTSQLSDKNNHFGKFIQPLDTSNKVININGQSNTFIQSGTSQNFISSHSGHVLHTKAAYSPSDQDPVVGISMPVDEEVYWHNKPQGSDPQTDPEETLTPVVYDAKMNNILDILDERSYYQERPEIKPSGIEKHAEIDPHEIPNTERYLKGEPNDPDGSNQHEPYEEPTVEVPSPDYNLGSPSLIRFPHNNYFHSYDRRSSRNRRSPGDINMNVFSDNSMFFNISSWKLKEINSKLNDALLEYRNLVDDYRKKITDKRETLFVDVLDGIIGHFEPKKIENSNEVRKIEKRSATITKLLNNPDVRLDVPKTLDNIGIITRNAFEDERSPMYHVRQFMGSTKNAVLSAMKIPPQNLVIPSNYEIKNIKPEEIEEEADDLVGGINPKILSRSGFRNSENDGDFEDPHISDPYGIVETFARVGGAIRDSVRSGQNTLNHISNIAHDARKIFHTTKNTVPRVLLPYAKAPVLTSRLKVNQRAPLKKAIIISPKVLDVKDPVIGSQKTEPNFVSMGNILDAIGLTKPNKDRIDLEKIVVKMPGQGETRGIYIPPIGEVKSVNGRKLPNLKGNEQIQKKTQENLGRIQDKVASTNRLVKENMKKLKNDISNTLDEAKNKIKYRTLQMRQRNNNENDLNVLTQTMNQNDMSKFKPKKNEIKHFTKEEENEIIDKFLYNIFKIDNNKSEPLVSMSNIKTHERNNFDIPFPDILPNITESVLEETIKNITIDILKEETKPGKKYVKTNKIRKNNSNTRKKLNSVKRPNVVLQSRFGDDKDTTTQPNDEYENTFVAKPNKKEEDIPIAPRKYPTASDLKGIDDNEEEAMKKVDEYVLNDVAPSDSPRDEQVKSSWKIGNGLELIEDPSAEESSNELKSGENEGEQKIPVFSSRNLLQFAEPENERQIMLKTKNKLRRSTRDIQNSEKVGLNLPPELMTPFMSIARNRNIDEIFTPEEENREQTEDENSTESITTSPTSPNSYSLNHEEDIEENTDDREVLGLNLPPELMQPFMARQSNANIDETFTSNEENEYNIENNNNDMQNNSPLLMLPLRKTKSVKKTLDEFLKKENETSQQKLNAQENRLKHSRQENNPESHGRYEKPIREQLHTIQPSDFLKKMPFMGSNTENCRMRGCNENPTSRYNNNYVNLNNRDANQPQNEQQNFVVCVRVYEDPHGSVLDNHQYSEYPSRRMEFDQENARKGVGQARTSMVVSENLRKPFMGLGNDETIKKFYEEYNKKEDEGGDLFGSEEEHLLFNDY